MLTAAVILLAAAALGGMLAGALHVQGRRPALILALGHGLVAVAGLALLGAELLQRPQPGMIAFALVFFGAALLCGLFMLVLRLGRKPISMALIALHGIFALLGFVCLLAGLAFSGLQ